MAQIMTMGEVLIDLTQTGLDETGNRSLQPFRAEHRQTLP